ncbi:SGNH hydrolase-type esterase domain-containing protein [Rhexocercosporidium sp. MPI-PUGE-AT-0058]|nr:SGNH hydrolase-type esterase domain-containing protein [Rhexocercosporidium sp. MPI-PUGE-AT-0058]
MILQAQHPLSLSLSISLSLTSPSPSPSISTLSPAFSSPTTSAPSHSSPCNNTTSSHTHFPKISSFYSLGDSYSAGIGANCSWITDTFDPTGSCLKCGGAYPYQIIEIANSSSSSSSSQYPPSHALSKSEFESESESQPPCDPEPDKTIQVYHLGCTGASISDILTLGWDNRTSQLQLMEEAIASGQLGKWATLSVGGNDVGFGDVVADCIMMNTAACEASLNRTEELLADPRLVRRLVRTYEAVIGVGSGTAARHGGRKDEDEDRMKGEEEEFTLIVPGYARFFNEVTEECDRRFFLRGRYLTREFRGRLNGMIEELNLVIRIAVAVAQMRLVFENRRGRVFFEDWDAVFEGRRFCEVGGGEEGEVEGLWMGRGGSWEKDAWFFTVLGGDDLGGGGPGGGPGDGKLRDIEMGDVTPPPGEEVVDFEKLGKECDVGSFGNGGWDERLLRDWARALEAEGAEIKENGESRDRDGELGKLSKTVYPWYVKKAMHPKSIAHRELGKIIYRRWMDGEYF